MMEGIGLGFFIGVGFVIIGRKVARPFLQTTIQAGVFTAQAIAESYREGKEMFSSVLAEAREASRTQRPKAQAASAPLAPRKRSISN